MRRRSAVLVFTAVALVAAACTPAPAPLSDPREILAAAVTHLRTARTVHLEASVDGSLSIGGILGGPAASGGALGLTGTHLGADLDLAGGRAAMRFQVPALLGLEGEVRQIGTETYLESSLTSRGWHVVTGVQLPVAVDRPLEWVDGLAAWLDRPSVVPVRLDDASCRAGSCYVVRVEAAAADIAALASAAPGLAAGLTGGSVSLELRISHASLVLSEAVLQVELPGSGSIAVSVTFTAWDAEVRVEAPSPSDIVAGPLLP